MKILALTKYSYEGPSSRYRFYNYKTYFESNGLNMTIKPLFNKAYFTSKGNISKIVVVLRSYIFRFFTVLSVLVSNRKYDLVLLEYELFPFMPAVFERLLKLRGIRYIVDYDDAIFHKYDMNENKIILGLLKDKIANVIRYAEHVIVCNEYLESYAKKYNDHTLRLPTVVLLDKYKQKMETFIKKEDNVFVIGWIGSRTTSIYILEILPAIEKFVDAYKNVRVDLVGFDKSLLSTEVLEKYHLNIITWTEEKEIENILNFDVGIMPLHDDPWSRGKCGFKLVQYMSCKKPVIASPVGMNCTLVNDGKNGFLVHSLDEWLEAFEKLYLDEKLRKTMSDDNFQKIENEYNYETNCQQYMELIKSVLKDKRC